MTYDKITTTLEAISQMGASVKTKFDNLSLTSGLHDTPTGYLGHSGDYLVVNDNESGIHFTGIEKIAADLTDYGFGGGSSDIPKYTNLPDPTSNDGKIVASGCDLYYGCDGEWKKIGADAIPPPENVPGCVSNLEEYNQYQEYKEQFLGNNMGNTAESILNNGTRLSEFIYDVCLFSDSELSSVKIDETTYKWGMFANTQTVNITATPGVASDREIQFSHWAGDGAVFGDANSSQTTLLVDKDLSVTGYFSEILEGTCEDIALHVQSNTTDASTTFTDSSSNTHAITRFGDTQHSTTNAYLGSTSMRFDGAGDYLQIGDTSTFKFLHDASTDYTIEGWFYLDSNIPTSNVVHRIMGHLINSSRDVAIDWFVRLDGQISFNIHRGQSGTVHRGVQTTVGAFQPDQWNHLAVVYTINNQPTIFLNGQNTLAPVSQYTNNLAPSTSNSTSSLAIGALAPGGTAGEKAWWPGRMQDIRISKKAIYTSNFTPPNSLLNNPCPVQPACEDVALHVQSNTTDASTTFTDLSSNTHAITRFGDTQHSTTNAYLGSTSMVFDGAGDYLSVPQSPSLNLQGDFTMEFWVKINAESNNASEPIITSWSNSTSTAEKWQLIRVSDNYASPEWRSLLRFQVYTGSTDASIIDLWANMRTPLDTWTHVAVVATGDTLSLFVDGQLQDSDTGWSNSTYSLYEPILIASRHMLNSSTNTPYYTDMNLQDLRITKKAIYTTNFTPPNSLLNNNCIYAVSFDGVDDYIELPANSNYAFGTNDFTIEAWVKADNSDYFNILQNLEFDAVASSTDYFFGINTQGSIGFNMHGSNASDRLFSSNSTFQYDGQFHHIAFTRTSGGCNIWYDGQNVATGSAFNTWDFNKVQAHTIGYRVTPNFGSGSIYGFRILNGTALYNAAFSPTFSNTTQLINDTVFLSFLKNELVDYSTTNNTINQFGGVSFENIV